MQDNLCASLPTTLTIICCSENQTRVFTSVMYHLSDNKDSLHVSPHCSRPMFPVSLYCQLLNKGTKKTTIQPYDYIAGSEEETCHINTGNKGTCLCFWMQCNSLAIKYTGNKLLGKMFALFVSLEKETEAKD